MTYNEYMNTARNCSSIEACNDIIATAAEDWTLSARQYENIRLTAILNAYK